MIIDTTKVDYEWMRKVSNLVIEGYLMPDENNVFNKIGDKTTITNVYYKDIIEDGKCIFNFGDCGGSFYLISNHSDINKNIDSLKGFPVKCKDFNISNFIIEHIDYLPKCENYDIISCRVKNISYPFPDKINNLTFKKNFIKNFDNFPKIINYDLCLEGNKYVSSEGFPIVNGGLFINDNNTLLELDNLKKGLKELEVIKMTNLQSIKIPNTTKNITIRNCANLTKINGLEQIKDDAILIIKDCPNLDPYMTLQSNAILKYYGDFGSNFMLYYSAFYANLVSKETRRVKDPRGLSREDFEWEVLKYWTEDPITYSNALKLNLEFDSNIKKREEILRSNKGIKKFNL